MRIGEKEPRVLGGKVLGCLGCKMSKFQLDKKGDSVQNGKASVVAYPKSVTIEALDMQMNVHIIRGRRRLGMACNHSTANRTWPPPSMSASTGCTVRAFSRISRLPPVRTDKPTLGWESGVTYKLKVCQHCGKEYQPTHNGQKYCAECRPVANAEKHRARAAKRYRENPEKCKASSRVSCAKWYGLHPERYVVHSSKRRTAKYANTPISEMLTSTEWLAILAEANGHCAYCDKEARLTLDHVIPLSKGGKHSKDNVVAACVHCNCSKGKQTLEEWIRTTGEVCHVE